MSQHQALVTILLLALAFVFINKMLRPGLESDIIVLIDIIIYTAFQLIIDVFIRRKERTQQHEGSVISK